ncbi:MAG: hypothetical protein IKD70_04815 [Eggerthellaceae bacterium]|nr:hypothetical protein [Eggerthellaceae bacterium]
MYLIICHETALGYWRRFRGSIALMPRIRFPELPNRPVILDAQIRKELSDASISFDAGHPLDLLFSRGGTCSQSSEIRSHRPRRPIPHNALVRVSEHVAVASPELCFAQVAPTRPLGRLLLDGCELCGTFVPDTAGAPPQERAPLTSAEDLRAFLVAMGAGREARVSRASRMIFDGAASQMEAKLALLLGLPQTMGGFGLPRPALNAPIALGPAALRVYPHSPCRVDLSWPGTGLAVEYDGRLHDEDRRDVDNARIVALRMEGFDVLVLRRQQVYDAQALASIARVIAAKLGRRLRVTTRDFWRRHMQLRRELGL